MLRFHSVCDKGMGMEHWWNDTDRGRSKYREKNLSQCHSVHHISHMICCFTLHKMLLFLDVRFVILTEVSRFRIV